MCCSQKEHDLPSHIRTDRFGGIDDLRPEDVNDVVLIRRAELDKEQPEMDQRIDAVLKPT